MVINHIGKNTFWAYVWKEICIGYNGIFPLYRSNVKHQVPMGQVKAYMECSCLDMFWNRQ